MVSIRSKSYPFLALAQAHGLDYGAVLMVADCVTKHPQDFTPHEVKAFLSLTEYNRDTVRELVCRQEVRCGSCIAFDDRAPGFCQNPRVERTQTGADDRCDQWVRR